MEILTEKWNDIISFISRTYLNFPDHFSIISLTFAKYQTTNNGKAVQYVKYYMYVVYIYMYKHIILYFHNVIGLHYQEFVQGLAVQCLRGLDDRGYF